LRIDEWIRTNKEANVGIRSQNSWLLVGVGFVALAVSFSA
jgi:hypothetical protein